MKTITRHPLTITFTVVVSDEVINHIQESDGTRYWALHSGDFVLQHDSNNEWFLTNDDCTRYDYDTETCLRGIALWVENGGDWAQLAERETDHTDHDSIWQYGFFGELVYG